MTFDFNKCEEIIGYSFKDKKLLINAFTHSSFSNEHKDYPSNERLEFLGDSLLGFIISEALYTKSLENEGKLTLKKQALVSKKPLSASMISYGVNEFLLVGEGVRKEKDNVNLAENLFESLVSAIYLDGGIDCAKKFVHRFLDVDSVFLSSDENSFIDYKSQLIHIVQKNQLGEVKFKEVSKSGPAHNLTFIMSVSVGGRELSCGKGSSHKEGEQRASKEAIKILQSEDSIL